MDSGNFQQSENGTRETVKHKRHGTKVTRMQDYTGMQKLLDEYGIGYDYLAATSGDALGTCHNALSMQQGRGQVKRYEAVSYAAMRRIRWAVEQLLQDRGFTDTARLAELWAEYDKPILEPFTQPGPEVA